MDWGEATDFVRFGAVGAAHVDECEYYILIAPQNVVGNTIMTDLGSMVRARALCPRPRSRTVVGNTMVVVDTTSRCPDRAPRYPLVGNIIMADLKVMVRVCLLCPRLCSVGQSRRDSWKDHCGFAVPYM